MKLTFRTLTVADFAYADAVLTASFGPSSSSSFQAELANYMAMQPHDWVLASVGDTPAGMGGTTYYASFAYIGLLGVLPTMQGHGIGRAVMEELLERSRKRACPTVLLDASGAGQPLYLRLGFLEDDRGLLLRRDTNSATLPFPPPPSHYREAITIMEERDIPAVVAFDTPYFGAARPGVLAAYLAENPGRAFVARNAAEKITGFLIAQSAKLGPWVAESYEDAERLLLRALDLPFTNDTPSVIIPAVNRDAERLLLRYGFSQQRSLAHMRLGDPVPKRDRTKFYGQPSFAIG